MSTRRWALVAAGLLFSAVALVLAFERVSLHPLALTPRVHWPELGAALRRARPVWLVAFGLVDVVSLVPRALQLRALARREDGRPPALAAAWHAVATAVLAQNVLPARLGEAARVVVLARAGGVTTAAAAAAVFLGRVVDLAGLVVATCLPVALSGGGTSGRLAQAAGYGTVAGVVLIGLSALVYARFGRAQAASASDEPLPPRERARRLARDFAAGLHALGSPKRLAQAGLTSVAAPLLVAAAYACALRAFGLTLGPTAPLALTAVVFLAVAVPSGPSALGVYHAAVTWTLAALGAPSADALAFAIATHVVGTVALTLAGAVSLALLRRHAPAGLPPLGTLP